MKKNILIKLHLYSGLFTAFYLVAFGLSALILNHGIEVNHKVVTKTWTASTAIDRTLSNNELADDIRDQLNLMGWPLPWEFKRDSSNFSFSIETPGKKIFIDADLLSGNLTISEAPKGLLAVFHGLHFLNGKIPNAPILIRSWAVYQWTALFVMLISIILGIWLWLKFSYKPWEGMVFGTLFLGIIVLMLML